MIQWSIGMGAASQIPKPVATAIKKCWPDGIVAEFYADESYFQEIRPQLQWDLRNIRGAALLWQAERPENGARWDEDGRKDEPLPGGDWQSYHLFFLAPDGKEFHFEDETEGGEEPEDPEEEEGTGTTAGEGWIGCAVGICLAAPFAALHLDRFSRYEDGSTWLPDVESFLVSDETDERVDSDRYYQEILSGKVHPRPPGATLTAPRHEKKNASRRRLPGGEGEARSSEPGLSGARASPPGLGRSRSPWMQGSESFWRPGREAVSPGKHGETIYF